MEKTNVGITVICGQIASGKQSLARALFHAANRFEGLEFAIFGNEETIRGFTRLTGNNVLEGVARLVRSRKSSERKVFHVIVVGHFNAAELETLHEADDLGIIYLGSELEESIDGVAKRLRSNDYHHLHDIEALMTKWTQHQKEVLPAVSRLQRAGDQPLGHPILILKSSLIFREQVFRSISFLPGVRDRLKNKMIHHASDREHHPAGKFIADIEKQSATTEPVRTADPALAMTTTASGTKNLPTVIQATVNAQMAASASLRPQLPIMAS